MALSLTSLFTFRLYELWTCATSIGVRSCWSAGECTSGEGDRWSLLGGDGLDVVGWGVLEVESELWGAVSPERWKRGVEGEKAVEELASDGVLGVSSSMFDWVFCHAGSEVARPIFLGDP